MHWHELLERLAATVLVGSGAVVLAASIREWRRALPGGDARLREGRRLDPATEALTGRVLLGAMAAGAAVIHLAVMPAHLQEFPPFGVAFGALAVFQLTVAAAAVAGWLRRVRVPVLAVMAAVVGVWLMSRTVGLPIGPHHWHAEAIGLTDATATSLEVGLVILLGLEARPSARPRRRIALDLASIAVVPMIGIIGLATLLAIAAPGAAEQEHSDHGSASSSREEFLADAP